MTSIILMATLAVAPAPNELLARVHAEYLQAGDISGKFTQTYVGGLRGKTKKETGRIWAKPDGRVRWQYDQPEPKYFIYDGKNAYFYEPQNSQVMIFDNFNETRMSTALRLLLGQADLAKHFDVSPCQAHCALATGNEVVVEMVPKETIANVDRVALVINPATKRIVKTVTFDSLGYRTEYAFTELAFHAKVPDNHFVFKKPPGVQELRATDMVNSKAR